MVVLRERTSFNEEKMTSENKKFCADCKTTRTPLWRAGPAGPKSLCNACGIRYRKKRRVIVGLQRTHGRKKERSHITTASISTNDCTNTTTDTTKNANSITAAGNGLTNESLKMGLMLLGSEMMLHRSSIVKKQRCQRRRKLGEEEQAAFSLMALSCASVLA